MAIVFTYTKSTNIVVVTGGTSGTPATFADFVTADRTGSVTLLAAWTPNSNTKALTYQITPVEKLGLLISFVVAGKTAEADYIYITGTDSWDAAQTESINVTAGNGTYISVLHWRTITNIDCSDNAAGGGTVWANGNVAVTQPQWGVIWNLSQNSYRIDCIFNIGDGSTSTYFTETYKNIAFSADKYFLNKAAAVTTFGTKIDVLNGKAGCQILLEDNDGTATTLTHLGTLNLYATNYISWGTSAGYLRDGYHFGGTHEFIQTMLSFGSLVYFDVATITMGNCFFIGIWNSFYCPSANLTLNNLNIKSCTAQSIAAVNSPFIVTITNSVVGVATTREFYINNANVLNMISCQVDGWRVNWAGTGLGQLWEKYYCDINVCDKDGVAISGATVDCIDTDGTAVWAAGTVTTDVSGNITQQIISYRKRTKDTTTTNITTTYSPHKFTISKAGYQTLVLDAITVNAPIKWHLELQGSSAIVGDLLIDVNSLDQAIFLGNSLILGL